MLCGDYKHRAVDFMKSKYSKIEDDITFWLRFVHEAGVMHCDIRYQNIVRIPNQQHFFHRVANYVSPLSIQLSSNHEWQLIDFSFGHLLVGDKSIESDTKGGFTSSATKYHATVNLTIHKNTGQYISGGNTLHRVGKKCAGNNFEYTWMVGDDYEMMMRALSIISMKELL